MQDSTQLARSLQGLKQTEAESRLKQFGYNKFKTAGSGGLLKIIAGIVREPMFILLSIACLLYFILGQMSEGLLMLAAMLIVTAISLYQELRSNNAIEALQQLTAPHVHVIRDGKLQSIAAENLVPGDLLQIEEGMTVPADADIVRQHDLSVNESVISGESLPVEKSGEGEQRHLYQGTTINSGQCLAVVTATGNNTVLGKLGKMVGNYEMPPTLLQQQTSALVRRLAIFGISGFVVILLVNYLHDQQWQNSLLLALTLAMSAIPEEIPVAFSSFMALGSYKMSRLGIISRRPQVIENLGAVSVVCLDKTGTITENKMRLREWYDFTTGKSGEWDPANATAASSLLYFAVLASERRPFDAMEKAIWEAWGQLPDKESSLPSMIHEYPLEGRPPMMTHVYDNNKVAGKGAAERVMRVCGLTEEQQQQIEIKIANMAKNGYRVIAVASAEVETPYPEKQDDYNWQFQGLLALYDPPRVNMAEVIRKFYSAHIDVKILTGDHAPTAANIATQIGIRNTDKMITGDQVLQMDEKELQKAVNQYTLFARMFPEAKLRVIEALKANAAIVAMTGDGVNDGPALKAANIGIALGQKGTEIARQAADLVITDDDLGKMVLAIREGRKIFSNLKKAIRYIISIHIPIILTAALPALLGWTFPNIFTPIHVIFLELIMGPTCSIFFEREPVEADIMQQQPRSSAGSLFSRGEMIISVVQGLMITAAVLGLYYYYMQQQATLEQTRTMVFSTLIISNIFLTFSNRSFTHSVIYTLRHRNNLAPVVLLAATLLLVLMLTVPAVRTIFHLAPISMNQFWLCLTVGFAGVMWMELYKFFIRHRHNK